MSETASPFAFSNMQIFFPTPVWIFDLPGERASSLNTRLRTDLESMLAPLPDIASGSTWQTEQTLHQVEEFAELMDIVMRAARDAIAALEIEHSALEVTGCWANINPRGSGHKSHVHPNNFLSGVYYLKVPPGSGTISFHEPRPQAHQFAPRAIEYNAFNSVSQSLPVEEGRLILFPAWLPHSVVPNPSDDVRISVSFNLMFTDFSSTMSAPVWKGLPLRRSR
jgi:uncharacterized protein (TIGR02466 family)